MRKNNTKEEAVAIAHRSSVTGKVSELTAAMALINVGWEVTLPVVDEVYDLVGKDPVNGEFYRFQVKTIRKRTDRDGTWYVINGVRGNGRIYTDDEIDYMLGVDAETGDVYMTECRNLSEYWQRPGGEGAKYRWVKLTAEKEAGELLAQ